MLTQWMVMNYLDQGNIYQFFNYFIIISEAPMFLNPILVY